MLTSDLIVNVGLVSKHPESDDLTPHIRPLGTGGSVKFEFKGLQTLSKTSLSYGTNTSYLSAILVMILASHEHLGPCRNML